MIEKQTVFVILLVFLVAVHSYGSNSFYLDFVYTNAEYGAGAAFTSRAWYNNNGGTFQKLRVDFLLPNGSVLQSQVFDFVSEDKWEVCGTNCAHQTYTAAAPNFNTASGFVSIACPPSDNTVQRQCPTTTCLGFQSSPNQAQGVNQLGFQPTGSNAMCLVRWTINSPDTYANEWHITNYLPAPQSSWPHGDPTVNTTYTSVFNGVTCPQPTCQSVVDIALVLDETGSICTAHAYPAVQQFALAVVNAFNGSYGPNGTRMGLVYFSGLDHCDNASDPGTWKACSSKGCIGDDSNCTNCGGRWDVQVSPPTTDQSALQQIIINHPIQKGYTCLTCGIVQGTNILNASPRPGVPRIIFFFTDGVDNRMTSYLPIVSAATRAQGIKIYVVGVASYSYQTLLSIAGNASQVYSSASYNTLLDLVPTIVKSFCDPLPPFAICPNCNGLCACSTTCTCPSSCNDGNVCTMDSCNVGATFGKCLYICNASSCTDGNYCSQDLCNPTTGCYFPPVTRPNNIPPDTLCVTYQCQSQPQGAVWTPTLNTTACPTTDQCLVNYCNNVTGTCSSINRNSTANGNVSCYYDALGAQHCVQGCGPPAGTPPCQLYYCSNGACVIQQNCQCTQNSDCYDNSGCTTNVCTNYQCVTTTVDCYSYFSNGACSLNTNYVTSNATGYAVYTGNSNPLYTQVTSNGNPSPASGTTRNCDQLACYGGYPSTYSCVSGGINNGNYTCIRTNSSLCSLSACVDTICQSVGQSGNWLGGNLVSNCGVSIVPNCNDGNVCTIDNCNSSWVRSDPSSLRCAHTSNSSTCNSASVCFTYGCNNMTGCYKTAVPLSTNNTCFGYYCDPVQGPQTVKLCTQNCVQPPNQCMISYCNVSVGTNGSCLTVSKTSFIFGTTQTYIDSCGNSFQVSGCSNPPGTPYCMNYYCNQTNGNCVLNNTCQCSQNSDCYDNTGCTNNTCVNYTCVNTNIDCFSILSNGMCALNTSYTTSNATGYAVYTGNLNSIYTQVDSNGNPSPSSGVTRNCDQLACYNGQPSTYSCVSTGTANGDYTCSRSSTTCSLAPCVDTICQSVGQTGTWSSGNLESNCGVTIYPNCNDGNVCTVDSCNSSWSRSDPSSLRCIHTSNTSNCNPNSVCYSWGCNNMTGCFKNLLSLPTNTTCLGYYCDPVQGNLSVCLTSQSCTAFPTNKCIVPYCNASTCQYVNKTTLFGTQVVQDCSGSITVQGCAAPPGSPTCLTYSCNQTTGNCQVSSNCNCTVDANCNDGNGCTQDHCNISIGVCYYINIDCYSYFSNGSCSLNTIYSTSNATGYAVYTGNLNSIYTQLDSYGNPSPGNTTTRNCDQLACYDGQQSTYSCASTGNYSYTCNRTSSPCSLGSCADTICQSVGQTTGTWATENLLSNCGVTIYPNCDDGNVCTVDSCNSTWSHSCSSSLRCIHTSNASNCVGNACQTAGCNNMTGCFTTQNSVPANTTCFQYYCDSVLGNQQLCVAQQSCAQGVNKCIVNYCNATTGCSTVSTTSCSAGNTQTVTDACGTVFTYQCCAPPPGNPYCVSYNCDPNTGNCIKNSTCQCMQDSDCYDNTGCTNNNCVNYTCVNTNIDCYSVVSNGMCALNTNYVTSNATGYAVYTGSTNSVYTQVDSNGNPSPSSGVTRNCDQLACYNGQPSTYSCVSTGTANGDYTCSRSSTTCSLAPCVDTICQSVGQTGTWSSGNLESNCGVTCYPNCNDGNVCTVDSCNSSWSRSDPSSLRCIHTSNTSNCNPNSVCYSWGCNPTTGCFANLLPLLGTNNTCFQYACDPVQGNLTFQVGTTNCPQNTNNFCLINYCDLTLLQCNSYNLATMIAGTNVTYTDSLGATHTVYGCAKPSSDNVTCRTYSCNPTTGSCVVNTSTCVCIQNIDCNDNNGCTNDNCDVINNVCLHTQIDCFNQLSLGNCVVDVNFTGSTVTGNAVWNGTASIYLTTLDSNNLPSGVDINRPYSCDQLACFDNQPSQYFCVSVNSSAHQCIRTFTKCPATGCSDGRCRTYGNWSNNQIVSDCSNYYYPTCISTNRCQVAYCNASSPDARSPTACFTVPYNVTQYCDDGNFCTNDYCNGNSTSANPCYHTAITQAVLKTTLCKKYSACQIVSCVVNSCIYTPVNCNFTNLCTYYVCNATTNNTCVAVNSTIYKYDKCGVCLGNGFECVFHNDVVGNGVSIGLAVGVGVGVSGCFAVAAGIFAARKGYDKYKELAAEMNPNIKVNTAYEGAEHAGQNPGLRDSAINN